MTITTTQIQQHRPSKDLHKLLNSLGPDFGKLQEKVKACFDQGRKEGLDDVEIGKLVRSRMKEYYHDSTIRRVLPDTAKQQQDHSAQKARKISAFDHDSAVNMTSDDHSEQNDGHEVIELPDDVKVEDITKPYIEIPQPQAQMQHQQPNKALREQSEHKEAKGVHNIAPEDYEIKYLEEYDRELLIGIVYFQDRQIRHLQDELKRYQSD